METNVCQLIWGGGGGGGVHFFWEVYGGMEGRDALEAPGVGLQGVKRFTKED